MKKLELWLPAPMNGITQKFAENATDLYKKSGLIGHSAIDWAATYGTPQYCVAENSYCYSVMNKDNSNLDKYRAVFSLVEGGNGLSDLSEVSYGHCKDIYAEVGKTYQPGDILYSAGNTGDVYAGGLKVSLAKKNAGSTAGTHLHAPQVRPVRRVKERSAKKQYLTDANGVLKYQGYYYEIVDYANGTNGCINPMPFFNGVLATEYTKKVLALMQKLLALRRLLGLK